MITGEIKAKVDRIWDTMWSGGISNPLSVIEQLTYLLFIKRLDELHTLKERKAARTGKPVEEVAADFVMTHRSSSIIQRAASVEEVANMVVYTCSPQASATTGAALRVDGGVLNTI